MDSFDDFDFNCIFSFTRKKSISKSKSVKSHRSTDTEDYMQIPVVIPQTAGIDPPRPPPPPPPIAPVTFTASAPASSPNGDTLASTKTNSSSSNIPIPPQPPQDTATRKQQQPLSAISIQDLNSVQVSEGVRCESICSLINFNLFHHNVQLRRTDKMLAKPFSTPTRSMSMQCLSSTNESFLSQKTDLIAELKMSKDIHGIKKMKVEKARLEGKYDKDAYSELTRQFTASHFVDQVCATQVCLLLFFIISKLSIRLRELKTFKFFKTRVFIGARKGQRWQYHTRLETSNACEKGSRTSKKRIRRTHGQRSRGQTPVIDTTMETRFIGPSRRGWT